MSTSPLTAPSLARRLAAFVYEGVLLFGVLFVAAYLYAAFTQQRHALQGRLGLMAILLFVPGLYFAWFWTHGGQTAAMKAWHLRVVDLAGQPLGSGRAVLRYLLSWLWFMPALISWWWFELPGPAVYVCLGVGGLGYALLTRLQPQRQFLHDVLSGTQLVDDRPTRR